MLHRERERERESANETWWNWWQLCRDRCDASIIKTVGSVGPLMMYIWMDCDVPTTVCNQFLGLGRGSKVWETEEEHSSPMERVSCICMLRWNDGYGTVTLPGLRAKGKTTTLAQTKDEEMKANHSKWTMAQRNWNSVGYSMWNHPRLRGMVNDLRRRIIHIFHWTHKIANGGYSSLIMVGQALVVYLQVLLVPSSVINLAGRYFSGRKRTQSDTVTHANNRSSMYGIFTYIYPINDPVL